MQSTTLTDGQREMLSTYIMILQFMQGSHAWSYSLCRVPTPPGKSWNCVCKISITWKVLENEFGHLHYIIRLLADLAHYRQIWRHPGPGKWVWSWNLLGNDADATICASTHLFCVQAVSLLFLHNMWQWWTYTPVWMLLSYYIYIYG